MFYQVTKKSEEKPTVNGDSQKEEEKKGEEGKEDEKKEEGKKEEEKKEDKKEEPKTEEKVEEKKEGGGKCVAGVESSESVLDPVFEAVLDPVFNRGTSDRLILITARPLLR